MKNFKLCSLLLVGTLALGSLTGCGKKEEISTQELFYQQLSNTMKYESIEFDMSTENVVLKENLPGNTLASSLVDINETIKQTTFIKGGFDLTTPGLNVSMGEVSDTKGNIDYLSLILDKKAAYVNIFGLFKNFSTFMNSSYMTSINKGKEILEENAENSEDEQNNISFNINVDMEEISQMVEMLTEYVPENYIMINFDELKESEITDIISSNEDTKEETIENEKSLEEQLSLIPKYLGFIKELGYATFKAVETSYEQSLIQIDNEAGYFYISMNPTLYKDFLTRTITVLEANIQTSIPAMYQQYFGEELVLDEKTMEEFNENIQNIKDTIAKTKDDAFETIVFAFFPGENTTKFVIQETKNQYESTTSTIIIKNNPTYTIIIPSNVKPIEKVLEDVMGAFFGGFGFEEEYETDIETNYEEEIVNEGEEVIGFTSKIKAPLSYLSQDMLSKQVQINEEVYSFPFSYEEISNNFEEEIIQTYYKNDAPLLLNTKLSIEDSSLNTTSIDILYDMNTGKIKTISFSEDFMFGEDLIKVILPKGMQIGKTYDDLVDCYGFPSSFELHNDSATYTYSSNDYNVSFEMKGDFITGIIISDESRLVTEESIEEYISK